MAAQSRRRRLSRSQSVPPKRSSPTTPFPGCLEFDQQVDSSFKESLCSEKSREDLRSGLFDTSPLPIASAQEDNPDSSHTIPRDVMAQWVASLNELKAEYDAEERSDPWSVPVVKADSTQVCLRKHSPAGPPTHLKMALECPQSTEEIATSLFGQLVDPAPPVCIANYNRFSRQRSMPLLLTQKLFP